MLWHGANVGELLELVGLASTSGSRVRTLSGGQRRRLDVALGIIGRPELLFLDEPTTGFDPEARRQFWDLIRLLSCDGTTIVLTTHYLEEAAALADRVAVVAGGRLAALDSPAHLTAHVASAATVRWIQDDVLHEQQTDRPTELIRRLRRRRRTGSADRHAAHPRRRLPGPDRRELT